MFVDFIYLRANKLLPLGKEGKKEEGKKDKFEYS